MQDPAAPQPSWGVQALGAAPSSASSPAEENGSAPSKGARRFRARPLILLGVALALLALGGALLLAALSSKPTPAPAAYFEVFFTDAPSDFEKVEVQIDGVYVGRERLLLSPVHETIDLRAHQGVRGAQLMAVGILPVQDASEIIVHFVAARAYENGAWVDLAVPDPWFALKHPFAAAPSLRTALLLDFALDQSIVPFGDGYAFNAVVQKVYQDDLAEADADASGAPEGAADSDAVFIEAEAQTPVGQLRSRTAGEIPALDGIANGVPFASSSAGLASASGVAARLPGQGSGAVSNAAPTTGPAPATTGGGGLNPNPTTTSTTTSSSSSSSSSSSPPPSSSSPPAGTYDTTRCGGIGSTSCGSSPTTTASQKSGGVSISI